MSVLKSLSAVFIWISILCAQSFAQAPIYYDSLRIVVGASTRITNLIMNTNQDTILKVQGRRSDNQLWEDVAANWATSANVYVQLLPPTLTHVWSFSPTKPGIGFIKVTLSGTPAESISVDFKVGPPTTATITIITPPELCRAGDTIVAVVEIKNKDGRVPGTYCYIGSVYRDTLGNKPGQAPPPIVIVDGVDTTLNTSPFDTIRTNECFTNSLNTVKFVLTNAPLDSQHRLSVNLGGIIVSTPAFPLLPGSLNSVRLEYDNGLVIGDTLKLTAPDDIAAIYSMGYDRFGNKIGQVKSNWQETGTLPPLMVSQNISHVLIETSNAPDNAMGMVTATMVNTTIKDSVYVIISASQTTINNQILIPDKLSFNCLAGNKISIGLDKTCTYSLQVYDFIGRKVWESRKHAQAGWHKIYMPLKLGTYLVKFNREEITIVKKVVVKP